VRYVSAIEKAILALESAASEIREMGCTCATGEQRNAEHAKNRQALCTGHSIALRYERDAQRARWSLGLTRKAVE